MFENFQHGFRVVVFSGLKEKVGEKVGEKLTINQQAILNLIQSNPYTSAKELSTKIGISSRKIEENIKKLKEAGIIKRVGAAKGGHWEMIH
ncbi:MAG: winged helix-turn-helix domain-containing protein [Marinilabiliaceae bacterium]|nr:winged helix-turn-helix domain-containing protein [Marinilabiliaceae bacterium]